MGPINFEIEERQDEKVPISPARVQIANKIGYTKASIILQTAEHGNVKTLQIRRSHLTTVSKNDNIAKMHPHNRPWEKKI